MLDKDSQYFDHVRLEMAHFLPEKVEKSIEFGCSNGHFSGYVKELKQCEAWGVDMDPASIEAAKEKLDKVICDDAFKAIESLPNHYFDCLICNDLMEHLSDPMDFLTKMSKKMKSGGTLIGSIPNIRYWKNVSHLVFQKDWQYEDAGILDYTHNKFFTMKSLRNFLGKARLDVEKVEGINRTKSLRFMIPNWLTLRIHDDMAYYQIAFVAKFVH